jgi:hypothetical protein
MLSIGPVDPGDEFPAVYALSRSKHSAAPRRAKMDPGARGAALPATSVPPKAKRSQFLRSGCQGRITLLDGQAIRSLDVCGWNFTVRQISSFLIVGRLLHCNIGSTTSFSRQSEPDRTRLRSREPTRALPTAEGAAAPGRCPAVVASRVDAAHAARCGCEMRSIGSNANSDGVGREKMALWIQDQWPPRLQSTWRRDYVTKYSGTRKVGESTSAQCPNREGS